MKIKHLLLVSLCTLSCVQKKECNISSIDKFILDTSTLEKKLIFENQRGNKDTLILLEKFNHLNNQSIQAVFNYEECSHAIGYKYESKKGNGNIWLRIDKNEQSQYNILINGLCFDYEVEMTDKEINSKDSIEVFIDKCDMSKLKNIALKKFKIISYTTQNNDIWNLMR